MGLEFHRSDNSFFGHYILDFNGRQWLNFNRFCNISLYGKFSILTKYFEEKRNRYDKGHCLRGLLDMNRQCIRRDWLWNWRTDKRQ